MKETKKEPENKRKSNIETVSDAVMGTLVPLCAVIYITVTYVLKDESLFAQGALLALAVTGYVAYEALEKNKETVQA